MKTPTILEQFRELPMFQAMRSANDFNQSQFDLTMKLTQHFLITIKDQMLECVGEGYDPNIRYDSSELYRRAKNEAIEEIRQAIITKFGE